MDAGRFVLFTGIVLIALLLLLGGAFAMLRSRRRGDEDGTPSQAEEPRTEAGGVMARPGEEGGQPQTGDLSAVSADRPAPSRIDLMNRLSDWQRKLPPDVILLNRDAVSGEWIVEIEGQRYRRLSDIHDDKAATKILSAIEGLKVFAGLASVGPAETASDSSAPIQASPPAGQPAGYVPPRTFGQATYPAPPGSIIAQIETILQREVLLHPETANRHIHMGAAPDGSLLIEIDSSYHKSPNDIPDANLRELVLRAVRTWEKSS